MKDYSIRYEKSEYNPDYYVCRMTFHRPDGVSLKEIYEALLKTDQKKLDRVWKANAGHGVQVFVNKGYALGGVTQDGLETYKKIKTKMESVLEEVDHNGEAGSVDFNTISNGVD